MATINPIQIFYDKFHRYPGNNKQWWGAKATSDDPDTGVKAGDFLPELLDKVYVGNTRAPRGHYIVQAFNINRSAISGISGIPSEVTQERPTSISFYSGRVWYGCNSTVYYSQIMDDKEKAGLCYQEADPTSEDISDLIASDGGVIPIPEASKIVKLIPMGNGILVFSLNGVWFISGTAAGFSALDISVTKITSVGTKSPLSIVETQDTIYWWSDVGIQAIKQSAGQFGPVEGKFDRANITETTIQTFYNDIPEEAKPYVKGIYDPVLNTIQWVYRDDTIQENYLYNCALLYDATIQAFYPWKFSSENSTEGPFVTGVYLGSGLNQLQNNDLVESNGVQVQSTGVDVIAAKFVTDIRATSVTYTVLSRQPETMGRWIASVNNVNFVDWGTYAYDSYVETGYQLLEDAMRDKQATYVFAYLRRTEDKYVLNDTGDYDLANPSSCTMQVKWDWAGTPKGGNWSRETEVYRHTRFEPVPADLDFDTGSAIVVTKNKVRGHGKSIQFRFGCNKPGYNFDLLGWSVPYTGNTEA